MTAPGAPVDLSVILPAHHEARNLSVAALGAEGRYRIA
jgi:hypothetical protein